MTPGVRKGVPLADDSGEAIEIIGALSDAGLLRTASGTPEFEAAPSEAVRLIGALGKAGLLATGGAAPAGGAPLPGAEAALEGPQVGDIVWVQDIRHINKSFEPDGPMVMEFQSRQVNGQWWQVQCAFPPNGDRWLAEIEKVLASGKPSALVLKVEVTSAPRTFPTSKIFSADVTYLVAAYRTPALPNVP